MASQGWLRKAAREWTVQAFADLASEQEGQYLEFKKASEFIRDGKVDRDIIRKELAETVSAFLNAGGGVLLIGVQTTKGREESLLPLDRWQVPTALEKQVTDRTPAQILDIIHGNIMPTPRGISVKTIEPSSAAEGPCSVQVVTVPPSRQGAHQSMFEMRYYKRVADKDAPMLDYEIRDVNSRRLEPVLEVDILPSDVQGGYSVGHPDAGPSVTRAPVESFRSQQGAAIRTHRVWFLIGLKNMGRATALSARLDLGVPSPWQSTNTTPPRFPAEPPGGQLSQRLHLNPTMVTTKGTKVSIGVGQAPELPHAIRRSVSGKILEQPVQWWTLIHDGRQEGMEALWSLEGELISVAEIELFRPEVSLDAPDRRSWFPWRVVAEGMPELRGVALLHQVPDAFQMHTVSPENASWASEFEEERFQELARMIEPA